MKKNSYGKANGRRKLYSWPDKLWRGEMNSLWRIKKAFSTCPFHPAFPFFPLVGLKVTEAALCSFHCWHYTTVSLCHVAADFFFSQLTARHFPFFHILSTTMRNDDNGVVTQIGRVICLDCYLVCKHCWYDDTITPYLQPVLNIHKPHWNTWNK